MLNKNLIIVLSFAGLLAIVICIGTSSDNHYRNLTQLEAIKSGCDWKLSYGRPIIENCKCKP